MELFIELRDHVDFVHKKIKSKFDKQNTLDQLQKRIHSEFFIENEKQQMFFEDGRELSGPGEKSIEAFGLKCLEKVIVKHLHLDCWSAYVNRVDEFKYAQMTDTKKRSAESAQSFYDLLIGSFFFTAYAKFDIEVTKYHKPISKYLDKRTHWIQNAATNFFKLSMFKGQNPVVQFEETSDGTRSAVICNLSVNSITQKYRIKTNHNAGESRQASRWDLDLCELYCYKLLESIRVGPKIVFIPNCVKSKSIIYLGSEWLPEFQSFNSIQNLNPTEISHSIVEIHFLSVFLSFGDMHEDNFGLNGSSDPIIVDFMMSNYEGPKKKFLHEDNIIRSIIARDILKNCDCTARLQIAKDAIKKWNFMEKLGEVLELMDKEKADFGGKNLDFEKKTKELEEFVEKVRSNIQDLFRD